MPQRIHPMRLYVGQGCQGLVTRIEDDGEVLCDIGAEEVARIPARLLGQGAAMRDLTWKTSWVIHLGYHCTSCLYFDDIRNDYCMCDMIQQYPTHQLQKQSIQSMNSELIKRREQYKQLYSHKEVGPKTGLPFFQVVVRKIQISDLSIPSLLMATSKTSSNAYCIYPKN